jgi:hypothetical protein
VTAPARIAKFTYAGHEIDVRVRDGYVNLTALCHAERKRARDLLRGKDADGYLQLVQVKTQICVSSLVERVRGGRTPSIWAHPLVASWVAERLSPEAAFFIHNTLRELHLTGVAVEVAERDVEQRVERLAAENERLRNDVQKLQRVRAQPSAVDKRTLERCQALNYGNSCPSCGSKDGPFHIDHFYSVEDADLSNLWLICKRCNQERRRQTAADRHRFQQAFNRFQELLVRITGEPLRLQL